MKLGVVGGTFDPIHNGHIAAAAAAQQALELDAIMLIPSRIPPHRASPAAASAEHRLAMAQLAAADRPGWQASRIELDREGPSYSFDTLVELGNGTQIFFILGADAFAEIATWSRYPALLDLAHFVVVSRPGITLDSLTARVPELTSRMTTPDRFRLSALGSQLSAQTRVILLESDTPDVSSTEIRRRVRAGESLRGLVPESVAAYINAHRLYLDVSLHGKND